MEKKKNKVKNKKNIIASVVVTIAFFAIFILVFCNIMNHYFDYEDDRNRTSEGSRPMFYADDSLEMDMAIPAESVDENITSAEYKVSLQSKNSDMTVCKYNLYYYWDENPYGYYRTGKEKEIVFTGYVNDKLMFENLQLDDYNLGNLKTLLSSYYIINQGNSITNQTWNVNASFIGRENQENILGQTYPGKIVAEDVVCTEGDYLKNQDISKNNNYICLNSFDEFCDDDDLYQILTVDDNGVKLVRTKPFGMSSYSEDLLSKLEDSFLDTDGKLIRGMILDHNWSMLRGASSKIGLLMVSDFELLDNIEDYIKPYFILSDMGEIMTNEGNEALNSEGYIYPVFYLDGDAVITRGDGSKGNPYFVN